ncbi:NAD(P)H-dependent glycerol-3-phosphate dehydrogenase [Candidatus Phytoplasma pini]|uniref:Glycerol-3-phosphate dehydrogenase n=1 Tax=Candidatus Phytoplasma pini TaxID=267362 RepID=A0A559KJD8_9MOLU|nr:NAD(P)H-dependent glycerol-3-phosphate dehydrogenase [Candidatus Phytoplasma pini]TVY12208.1 Glycerol-3-phosphate dehydrogenase [Candidatus Phytoplasma pini]
MSKITILGGGAWGSTIGQVLVDNRNQVLIYDINEKYVEKINNHQHPIFNFSLLNIKATNDLQTALDYSDIIILCVSTQQIRSLFKQINLILKKKKKSFINVSKGIELKSKKIISQILLEEINSDKITNYACLIGPSHAEEVVQRKITFLLAASKSDDFLSRISQIFSSSYLKIDFSYDVFGCEICSAFKNALSFVSGIVELENFSQNAKSAFITFGIQEMKKILEIFPVEKETFLGLAGLGDLIVTSFNLNSRNYQAGKKINLGENLEKVLSSSSQVIEGIYNLEVFYHLSIEKKIFLPLIQSSYQVVFQKKPIDCIFANILKKSYD